MKKEKNVKLYSAFFPFYGVLLADYSNVWWMALANIAILILISFVVLKLSKTENWKGKLPKVVGRSFGAATLADVAAIIFRFLPTIAEGVLRLVGAEKAALYLEKYVSDFTWYEIWAHWNPIGLPWTIASILVAGIVAFVLNYCWLMKKLVPEKKTRMILSIIFAVFSAPYTWTNPAW